jgi:hypothetical protein
MYQLNTMKMSVHDVVAKYVVNALIPSMILNKRTLHEN